MRFTLCLLSLCLTLTLSAQEIPRWKSASFGLLLGSQTDRYAAMSMDYMRAYAQQTSLMDIDLQGMQQEVISEVQGGMMVFSLSLNPRSAEGTHYLSNQELRLGLELHAGRESMIMWTEAGSTNSLIYCVIQNEVILNGAYLIRYEQLPIIDLYIGAGGGLGKTFANEFVFINETNQSFAGEHNNGDGHSYFRASGSTFYRVYIPAGVDLHLFKNLELTLEARYGMGAERVSGDRTYRIPGTYAAMFGMKYLM